MTKPIFSIVIPAYNEAARIGTTLESIARQTIHRFGFDIEVLIIARKNGFKIQELPVVWDNPAGSKVTFVAYLQTLGELIRISRNRMIGRYSLEVRMREMNV